jgi:starch phosphorylase
MLTDALPLLQYVRFLTGRPPERAHPHQWLAGLAALARGRVAEQWGQDAAASPETGGKHIYYLSMEFLPGRFLLSALHNLGLYETCRGMLADHGLNLDAVAELEADPALGNGGLGRLAACLLDSMASLGLAAHGYGIRYDCGLFTQQFEDGWQVERPDPWLRHGNPWEVPRADLTHAVGFGGRTIDHGANARPRHAWLDSDKVLATAYDMPVLGYASQRLNTLRLWSPRGAHELDLHSFNNGDHAGAFARKNEIESLSQVLYPGDATPAGRELRFKQEYFFVSASVQDILRRFRRRGRPLECLPDDVVIHINDTHPSLAIVELMRLLLDVSRLDWEQAWLLTGRCFAYTNHTLMPEALETWPLAFFERLLPRHLQIIYEINDRLLRDVRRRRPHDPALVRRVSLVDEDNERRIRMAHLAVVGSRKVNGVSKIHTALMRRTTFADFAALYPAKIVNVTNGISFRRWLHEANPELVALIRSRIGDRWLEHADGIAALAPHAEDAEFRAAFRAIKHRKKLALRDLIGRESGIAADAGSLFDVHIKRIHEYKRQLLKLLHVVALYRRLRQGAAPPGVSRTVIFAGKAAPGYVMAKLILKLIHDVAARVNADPAVNRRLRVAFIADYGVRKAQIIIPAADLSEQISTAGHEASGTGNMKLALNGALTVGTLDGANIEIREAVGEENFFAFGATIDEVARLRADGYDPSHCCRDDPELAGVLELIASGHFSPSAPDLFRPIVDRLTSGGDPYLVLADFRSYLRCQEQIESDFGDAEEWSRRAILNIAGMAGFSSDHAVRRYAALVWDLEQQPGETARDGRIESHAVAAAE